MNDSDEKPRDPRIRRDGKVNGRLRAMRLRSARTREFLDELLVHGAVAPTVRTLVDRLTTLDLVIGRLEGRLALGQPVDLLELTTLINSQRLLVKAVRETVATSGGSGLNVYAHTPGPTLAQFEAMRLRFERSGNGQDVITGEPLPTHEPAQPALEPIATPELAPIIFPDPPTDTEH